MARDHKQRNKAQRIARQQPAGTKLLRRFYKRANGERGTAAQARAWWPEYRLPLGSAPEPTDLVL